MSYTIHPKWQIWVYPFRNTNPQLNNGKSINTDYYTNDKAFQNPVPIPMECVENFDYNDTLESGDFTIEIHKGIYIIFQYNKYKIALDELLSIGHPVCFKENGKVKFSGYILKRSRNEKATGESSFTVTGSGLEGIPERQLITIDLHTKYASDNKLIEDLQIDKDVTKYNSALTGSLNTLPKNISNMKTPSGVIKNVFEGLLNTYLNLSSFGGSKLLELINTEYGLSEDSYSQGLNHVIPWISQAAFGNQINYWNLMETIAITPLYELFFHYNESNEFWISETQTIDKNYSSEWDEKEIGNLVFRKSPWKYLNNYYDTNSNSANEEITDNSEINFIEIPESHIVDFDLEDNIDDIFTGIQVIMASFDSKKINKIAPVLYNPNLLAKYGQRVMTVKLEGLQFSNRNNPNPEKKGINYIVELRDMIYKHFGLGQKIISGSFDIDYHREITKGQILRIVSNEETPATKVLNRYMPDFYISGIKTSCNPSTGECSQTLTVKWGEARTKLKDYKNPANDSLNLHGSEKSKTDFGLAKEDPGKDDLKDSEKPEIVNSDISSDSDFLNQSNSVYTGEF